MAGRWRTRRRCGAKTRKGRPCVAKALPNGRCRHHGGLSTGPRPEADMRCWRSIAARCKARGQPRKLWRRRIAARDEHHRYPGVGVHTRLGTRRAERQQGFDRRRAALRCRPFAEPAGRRPRAVDAACRPAATKDGVLVIRAERFRTQEQNREDARDRLAELVRRATFVPRPRIATRPTRASKERRIEAKVRRSTTKRRRRAKPELK
jgi:hypothetical protein